MHPLLFALALGASAHVRPTDSLPPGAPAPHEVSGTVSDSSNKPIQDARVSLVELRRLSTTGPEGHFSFPGVAPGVYHLSISAIGFAPRLERVAVADSDVVLTIALRPSVVELEALQVTASPNATTLLNSPQRSSADQAVTVQRK